ncbi:acyltransferase family protein [Mucilaginibacter sp.]|uniref:acyltransferase family protein n=1 Tax=Mucilaginibacter sp. TaxID=1882438 RepID=UPI003D1097FF
MNDTVVTPGSKKRDKVFFPNLNGVRAIAALMVVVAHIEFHKKDFNLIQSRFSQFRLFDFGKIGVTVFFSLSGFLITYLLLEEKETFMQVNFKDFYIRRILRIWPLYFLVILFGFFVYPGSDSSGALWLSIFFVPNIAFCLNLLPLIFDPIWSIGIEEQFYIFHPHFFRIKKLQNLLYALLLFIVLFFVASYLIRYFTRNDHHETALTQFFYYARYDNMMIGAIVAILYFNTKNNIFSFKFQRVFNLLFNKYAQVILILAFWIFAILYVTYPIPQGDVVISILAAFLIMNLCEAKTSIYSLSHKGFQFIGKISYGIYLLHKFPLFLVLYLVGTYMKGQSFLVQNIVIYAATLLSLTGLASLSYYGYERYFLEIKKRFQKVKSNQI